MKGRASIMSPTVMGAMTKTSVLEDVRISRVVSSLSPPASALDILGKSRFVATKEKTPTIMIYSLLE
jgi:hypothetical protein